MQNTQQYSKQKSTQLPIYPFYIKFSSQKQKHQSFSNPYPYSSVSTQPFADDGSASEQQYYNQSFQSYNSQNYEEYIDQVTEEIDQQDYQNKLEEEINQIQDVSQQSGISLDYLRKANQKLIRLKQQYRAITAKYKHNIFILRRQRQQLQMLRSLRDKAMDYDYEFQIGQQYERNRVHSHSIASSINKESTLIKKSKYRRLKLQQSLNDPQDSCCILSSSRILDNKAVSMFSVVKKREQILSKRRQEEANNAYLLVLQKKESQYIKMIDFYDSYIYKGSEHNLQKRTKLLKEQIQLRKSMLLAKEKGVNFDCSLIKNQLLTIQTKILTYEDQIQQIQRDIQEQNILKSQPNAKINTIDKKNSYFKNNKKIANTIVRSELKLDKIQTPKSKIKMVLNQKFLTPSIKQSKIKLTKLNSYRYCRQHTTQN